VASPTGLTSPTEARSSGSGPRPEEIPPPDPIHNADLLPFACSYPFDEVIESEYGHGTLKRTEFSLVGYGEKTSCGLRQGGRNIAIVHVYKPLEGAPLRRRVRDLMDEPELQQEYNGTALFFDDPDSSGFVRDSYVGFIAHTEDAVLVNLDLGVWPDASAQLQEIARQIVRSLDGTE